MIEIFWLVFKKLIIFQTTIPEYSQSFDWSLRKISLCLEGTKNNATKFLGKEAFVKKSWPVLTTPIPRNEIVYELCITVFIAVCLGENSVMLKSIRVDQPQRTNIMRKVSRQLSDAMYLEQVPNQVLWAELSIDGHFFERCAKSTEWHVVRHQASTLLQR